MGIFAAVVAIVIGIAMFLQQGSSNKVEERLQLLAGLGGTGGREGGAKSPSLLSQPLDSRPGLLQEFLEQFGNVSLLFEQADVSLTVGKLLLICGVLAVAAVAGGIAMQLPPGAWPVLGLVCGGLPIIWLLFRRRRRLRRFAALLPEALEMLARALRAGQSLPFGFHMVSSEVAAPLGSEFGRVFDEQNLGVSLEQSLGEMAVRIPNLDLRFFVTAVILQRQTGGDLAEILDKIGYIVRERFKIWGQIQALTAEGRISGIVLLALPVALFLTVYKLNPEYVKLLFVDPMGKKLLAVAIVLQVVGALVIRKIINIKV
jgi:tight adherence protein B